jgi:hypothetical protein
MDKFKKATTDLIAALDDHEHVHTQTVTAQDAESRKRYEDSYDRVRQARKHCKQPFQPGSFHR